MRQSEPGELSRIRRSTPSNKASANNFRGISMLNLSQEIYDRNIQSTRLALKDAILSINIWDREMGLTLAEWQGNPTAVALITQLVNELDQVLKAGGLEKFEDYLYLDLADNTALVILDHGDNLMQGWLINTDKANLGILLGMAVPTALSNIKSAKSSN